MLSQLDNIIFPDRCDILEIVPSQRYVYPIYKNASTSLYNSGFRLLEDDEIKNLKVVDIFVRDPYQRYISGIDTFLRHNKNLDVHTALHFVTNYLFLNNHFCPQFHWLVNLQRFTTAKIRINSITEIENVTNVKINPIDWFPTDHPNQDLIKQSVKHLEKIHFYLSIDKVLTENLIGKTVPFKVILKTLQHNYPDVFNEIIQRSVDLCSVLD